MILLIIIAGAYLALLCYNTLLHIAKISKERFVLHLIGCLIALAILIGGGFSLCIRT